ncbi:hypothetical protein [Aliiglaciecola sp. LCG003]|uniref:PLDc N-terminal domain-containing protein n=1 Tax=Aliiglaciecola sp. LCG003 TaxID=3053655 RepID=UPI0025733B1E|nr:hypothetical protein [Aliiglaciecola sp. LCG003]WJG10800.1 hypothetical protein QR722_07115 [Aliiglaciecola sp. LCG003]
MGSIGITQILLVFIIWCLPIILIVKSTKTTGGEKLAWVLAIVFISWLAWIFYLLLAPISNSGNRQSR